jgi:hypothetical protein
MAILNSKEIISEDVLLQIKEVGFGEKGNFSGGLQRKENDDNFLQSHQY